MALILCLETSTTVCSVCVCKDGHILGALAVEQENSHATSLAPLIQQLFDHNEMPAMSDIDAVAVSSGPGSYTGLRIGVSTAKGICYALQKPLLAIPSLEILAFSDRVEAHEYDYVVPMIDARRMEVYAGVFNRFREQLMPTAAVVVDENSFSEWTANGKVLFVGNGAEKCRSLLGTENTVFDATIAPLAASMASLAEEVFERGRFEDLAYFEPFYLKDFIATTPRNKVL